MSIGGLAQPEWSPCRNTPILMTFITKQCSMLQIPFSLFSEMPKYDAICEQVFTKNGTNGKSFLESILVLIPLEDERESGVNECVSLLNRNRSFVEELCVTQQARETEVDFFQPVSSFSPRMYSPYWLHWHYKTLGEVSMWAIRGAYCVTVIDVTSTDRVCI